jgi:hypothetical protein
MGSRSSASVHGVPGRTTQGGNIVKSKVVISVLAVIGIVALSVTAAQAAGNAPPMLFSSFFVCQGINGEAPGTTVSVQGSNLGNNPKNVTLGNGSLACAVARLFDKNGVEIPPPQVFANGLKCYNVSVSRKSTDPTLKPPTHWSFSDFLFPNPNGLETDVSVSSFQYVCSPATFSPQF